MIKRVFDMPAMVRVVADRVCEEFDVEADIYDEEGWSVLTLHPGRDQLMLIVNFDGTYQLESRTRKYMEDAYFESDKFDENVDFLVNATITFAKTGSVFTVPPRRSFGSPRDWTPWPQAVDGSPPS